MFLFTFQAIVKPGSEIAHDKFITPTEITQTFRTGLQTPSSGVEQIIVSNVRNPVNPA